MKNKNSKQRILILGASGFIGNTLYKELLPYFDVYGTYKTANEHLQQNQVMYQFDVEKDDIDVILNEVQPNLIISSLRGDFIAQYKVHEQISAYVMTNDNCRVLYLSTVNVFDGKYYLPSYENDLLLAESKYGKFKVSVERIFNELPKEKFTILRLPLVLGVNAPRIIQLKQAKKHEASFEVYPNLIISVTTANKIAQQIHYIINKNLFGIFHLSSSDMIHHEELFIEISDRLDLENVIFKQTYTSNEDRYLAILPKKNKLPKAYRITVSEVINDITLKEEISTLKK